MSLSGKRIVIIGGGPAGVSAAAYALKNGFSEVTLIESHKALGGLHRSVELDGLHFDLGAFFFWEHHTLLHLFPELKAELVYAEATRHFSLTQQYNLDRYPLTLKNYLREQGYFNSLIDIVRLLLGRIQKPVKNAKNVSEVLNYYMGPLFRKTGLHFYIERLYGVDPKSLDSEFAYHRVGGLIAKFRLKNILRAVVRAKVSYFKEFTTVKQTWARPESGFETMYAHIQQLLEKQNCRILLQEPVLHIHVRDKIVETSSGKKIGYDYLLTSQPLLTTAKMSGINFELKLKYRALCSLFYEMPNPVMEECFVLFNFTSSGKWKRITFHSNYYNRTKNESGELRHYFVVESIPAHENDEGPEMVQAADTDFKETFRGTKWEQTFRNAKLLGHHLTKNAYPVFDQDFDRNTIRKFKEEMRSHDVFLVGRQGQFVHHSSSDAARSSIRAIDEIIDFNKEEQVTTSC